MAVGPVCGCGGRHAELRRTTSPSEEGRLTARPATAPAIIEPGLHTLGIAKERDALLYVPPKYKSGTPVRLAISLHGATGNGERGIRLLQQEADKSGFVVLAPSSRGHTWDMIADGRFGPDVSALNDALARVFQMCTVDPRIAISGFSDGASYALSLGITNGDLFSTLLAFSPGFVAPRSTVGMPKIYISHGTRDNILPIAQCGRPLAKQLRGAGYTVKYHEFDGRHEIPHDLRDEAITWWLT
jgi:predicted esterase